MKSIISEKERCFQYNGECFESKILEGHTLKCSKPGLSHFENMSELKIASKIKRADKERLHRIEIYMARHLLNQIKGTEKTLFWEQGIL